MANPIYALSMTNKLKIPGTDEQYIKRTQKSFKNCGYKSSYSKFSFGASAFERVITSRFYLN